MLINENTKLMLHKSFAERFAKETMFDSELPSDFTESSVVQYVNENGVAVISAHGPVLRETDALTKFLGYVSTREIEDAIVQAGFDMDVKGVLLSFETPGGDASYLPELANTIKSFKKPIGAYVEGYCFSAGMYIGVACDFIYGNISSEVGSIGVLQVVQDVSEFYKRAGVNVQVFKSSPLKGAGVEGTSLTEAQKENIQAGIDYLYKEFVDHVKSSRPSVKDEALLATTYFAKQAVDVGLMDAVTTREQAIRDVLALSKLKN